MAGFRPAYSAVNSHTDIRTEGWVARLPGGWRPYALLMRLDRPIGSWLLFLPGPWAFAMAAPSWAEGIRLTILFGVGAVLMRGAGCVINDLWDRDLDRKVARTAGRPLASGVVRPKQALLLLIVLLLVSLAILLQLNRAAILLGVLSLVPVALYPLAKRFTNWPQVVLGLVFSWAAPMGYAACTGYLDAAGLLLYAAGIVWILGYDTIYAHQDREDDALIGIGSTALRWGEKTRPFLAACYAATVALLLASGWAAGLHWLFVPALLPATAMLGWQVVTLDIHDPALCLRLFKANRDVGLLIALALLAGRL